MRVMQVLIKETGKDENKSVDKQGIWEKACKLYSPVSEYTSSNTILKDRVFQELDPYSLFLYAMNSQVTRDRYTTRLQRFFSFIGIEGATIQERCRLFAENGRNDSNWAFKSIVSFLQIQKERVDRKEITGSTIRNYVKAIKLFTEMNDILK